MGVFKSLHALILVGALLAVNKSLPYPYMDEIFHVRQTLQYVIYQNFREWDPKITTPPGLYAVAFIICEFLNNHSLLLLRAINVAPLLFTLIVSRRGLVLATFPLLVFFSTVFYTDVWSTLLVIAALSTPISTVRSAFFCLVALTFRQTNIIWTGLAASFFFVSTNATISQLIADLRGPRRVLARGKLLAIGIPFGTVVGLFAVFLKWNGGIPLGDKSNHGVSFHGAQLLYFVLFLAFYSAPLAVPWVLRGGPLQTQRSVTIKNLVKQAVRVGIEFAVIITLIRTGTIVHPFILADNRHFTFYFWRYFVAPFHHMLLIPVYWFAWRWFSSTLDFRLVRTWLYLGATALVLVPSPLLEPRYYVVPYLVWRVCLFGQRGQILEYVWNTVLNVATISVFCLSRTHFMY